MLSRRRKQVREETIISKGAAISRETAAAELEKLRQVQKDHERLKIEHELLEKGDRVHFQTKSDVFAFIDHQPKAGYAVTTMCALHEVSSSGY